MPLNPYKIFEGYNSFRYKLWEEGSKILTHIKTQMITE